MSLHGVFFAGSFSMEPDRAALTGIKYTFGDRDFRVVTGSGDSTAIFLWSCKVRVSDIDDGFSEHEDATSDTRGTMIVRSTIGGEEGIDLGDGGRDEEMGNRKYGFRLNIEFVRSNKSRSTCQNSKSELVE